MISHLLVSKMQEFFYYVHVLIFFKYQADDVKALLCDANVTNDSEAVEPSSMSSKNNIASKGLTAAGASLLESETLPDYQGIGKRIGDGSDKSFRDSSGDKCS